MNASCYCTALRDAARRVSAIYDEALAPAGVSAAQLALLRAVGRLGPLAITDLGRELGLERSTVGRNVRVLERGGLLRLARGKGDQREVPTALTAAGRKLLKDAAPLWTAAQKRIEDNLGASGTKEFFAMLNIL